VGVRPLREWMRPVLTLVLELYGERALHRHDRDEQRLLAFARRLREVATAFERVPPDLDQPCDAATAIHLVLDQIAGDALPPEADEVAVELLGWLELHLDDAPVAILTGMNEPFVPEALNADAFLPNALRSRLGIEDNNRRYARDAYQLTAMLHSRHVHVIAGRRTILGDPLRPSRLLLATSGPVLARRVRGFLDEDAAAVSAPAALPDSGTSAFRLPPDPVISLPSVPTSLHVTGFGKVLADPYRWALDCLIGGDIVEDAVREMDPRRFGTLAHRVLQEFGRTPAACSADERVVRDALDACLDGWVATHFGAVFPAARLQIEQLRMRLHRFAAAQAARIAEGWRTVGVECGTPGDGVPLLVDGEEFLVSGRIDRIDVHEQRGAWAVLDYKTGDRGEDPEQTHLKKGEWKELQLPLYHLILPHVVGRDGTRVFTGDERSSIHLGYALLCADPERIGFAEVQWTQPDLDDALEAARDVVRTLRENRFTFARRENRWDDPDVKELLGFGRLALAEDEQMEEVPA
jgi:ATP-dependent helicase/nuclease subunit B